MPNSITSDIAKGKTQTNQYSIPKDEQEREKKKSALIEKRQQVEAKWQTIQQWEEDLMTTEVKLQMKHMPEVRIY